MKKAISILMLFILICTLCIGLVACNQKSQNLDYYLLKNKDFSFGKIVKTENFVFGDSPITHNAYPDRYDIVIKNDTQFIPTVNALQTAYDKYLNEYAEGKADFNFSSNLFGNKMVFRIDHWHFSSDYIEQHDKYLEIKDKFADYLVGEDLLESYAYSDIVHDIYQIGDYMCMYASSLGVKKQFLMYNPFSDKREYFKMVFYTMIYREGWKRILVLSSFIVFNENVGRLQKINGKYIADSIIKKHMTVDERHEIASYYQPIHREIITSWLESDGGKKYVAENLDKYIGA